jgi:hypothetical protein
VVKKIFKITLVILGILAIFCGVYVGFVLNALGEPAKVQFVVNAFPLNDIAAWQL